MFTLIIEDKDGAIADEYSFEEGEFIIGRSHSSDIILPSDNVSRRHSRLYTQDGRCFIEDLNSSNGVFVNGKRIHRVFEIVRSAQIKVGDYYLHVEGAGYAPEGDAWDGGGGYVERQQGAQAAADMGIDVSAPEGGDIYGRLIGTNLATQGRPFDIIKPVNLVGRGKDCSVTVIDPSVSRIHAKVLRNPDGSLRVEDLRSSNGCYVNDERVSAGDFGHGDRVRFGNVEFICEMPGMGDPEVVEVSSGGRKGLIILVLFLSIVLVGSAVTIFLLRDRIFGGGAEVDTTEEDQKKRVEREQHEVAERAERLKTARTKLKKLIRNAEKLAERDDWPRAEKELQKGAKVLDRIGGLDEKGELTTFFQAAEDRLRQDRRDYEGFLDDLQEERYRDAGVAFKALHKRGNGPMYRLAKKKLGPVKDELLRKADAAAAKERHDTAVKWLQRAASLDQTDQSLGRKLAKARLKAKEQEANKKKEEEAPAPSP